MYAEELLLGLLKLDQSWSIGQVDTDLPSNRLDITIHFGSKKKRFFWQSADISSEGYITLRHLPVWGMRTFLHVPAPDTVASDKSWMPPYSRFTHEMEECVIEAFSHCQSIQGTARIVGLTATEVREILERTGADTEIGRPQPQPDDTPSDDLTPQYATAQSFDLDLSYDSKRIPPETHAGWQQLLDGKVQLVSYTVGLQMLLQRVRQAIVNNPTETERLAGTRLVRQYFIKNQSVHEQDIRLLFSDSPVTLVPPTADASGLADDRDRRWRSIIDGEILLETSHVGLQMMLEQIRRSIARNSSESNYLAGAKLLRQFFDRHRNQLGVELGQLGFTEAAAEQPLPPTEAAIAVPANTDPIWQRLIDGELTLRTDTVSLQMMLVQLRQSVLRNPTESARMAGIKILHQFFLKHELQLAAELQQLHAAPGSIADTGTTVSKSAQVPVESALVWQRLISGDLQIQTDAVALKMMLEGVRISIQNNPSDAKKMAGVKMLRQYFIKHQRLHTTELSQLIAA